MLRLTSPWEKILIGGVLGFLLVLLTTWWNHIGLVSNLANVLFPYMDLFYYLHWIGLNRIIYLYAVYQIHSKVIHCRDSLTQQRQGKRTSVPFFQSAFLWFRPEVDSIIQQCQKEENWYGLIFFIVIRVMNQGFSFAVYQNLSLLAPFWSGLPWPMPERYLISPATVS